MIKKKIGWIGLGNMGKPMATNIINGGYPLTVYNRNLIKTKSLSDLGAQVASDLSTLTTNSDIIFTMVSDDEAVNSIYLDQDGILENAKDKLFIDMSTIKPDTSIIVATAINKAGGHFLNAPVSGSIKPAIDGQLVILCGGELEDYDTALPLLNLLGKKSILLGPVGSGNKAKLAINYYLALVVQGIAETILFAEKNGICREDMMNIINIGALGNGLSQVKTYAIINNEFPPAFALKLMFKDLRLAREQGMDFPLSGPLFDTYKQGVENGLGEQDVMAILSFLHQS